MYLSEQDKKNIDDIPQSAGHEWTPSFYETFSTAVGQTIDENLSISRTINSGRYVDRANLVQEMEAAGEIDAGVLIRHRDINGQVNWNAIANEVADDRIKTNEQIETEIADELAWRRENSKQYLENGSGVAKFLGEANSYMLDPINMASMLVTAPVAIGAKGFQGVFQAAARGGLISAGSETLIQPLVFKFKSDIDSPYSATDAIGAIATAAIGGAAIDSGIHGMASLVRRLRGDVEKVKAAGFKEPDLDAAEISLAKIDDALQDSKTDVAKVFKPDESEDYWLTSEGKKFAEEVAENVRSDSDIKSQKIKGEKQQAEDFDYNAEVEKLAAKKIEDAEARAKAEFDASKKALSELEVKLKDADTKEDISLIEGLAAESTARMNKAESDILALTQQIESGEFNKAVAKEVDLKIIEAEKTQLKTYFDTYNAAIKPNKVDKPRIRVKPGQDLRGSTKSMESAKEQGIDYTSELEEFNALDSDILIEFEGQQVNPKELVAKFDDDIETMNQLEACYLG